MIVTRKLLPLMLLGLAVSTVWWAYGYARTIARDQASANTMRQLGLGLLNYESTYGRFPPSQMGGHSWRIRLVPLLVSSAHFMNYDFGLSWDHADNMLLDRRPIPLGKGPNPEKQVIAGMPFDYANGGCVRHNTAFVMLVGNNAFGGDNKGRAISELSDSRANTIAIAQTARSDIHWLHPLDLDVGAMSYRINDGPNSISTDDGTMPLVCFADAAVYRIDPKIPAQALRSLVTIDGHKKWTRDSVQEHGWLHPAK